MLRIYWVLLLSGFNVVKHVVDQINDSQLNTGVATLEEAFKKNAQEIKTFWEKVN